MLFRQRPHYKYLSIINEFERFTASIVSHLDWKQVESGNLSAVLERGHVDGYLCRAWISPQVEEMLANIDVPIVLLDCDRQIDRYSSVHVNNIKAMDLLVDHLVKRGAKRFATITGDMQHLNAQERLAGVQMALTRRGIQLPSENVIMESGFCIENGKKGVSKLLESGHRFDALVCQYDLMAYGAMEELSLAGVKVPDDVLVTGFDNEGFSDKLAVPLTTIDTNSFQSARLGVQLLMAQASGENRHTMHLQSEVSLVVRESA